MIANFACENIVRFPALIDARLADGAYGPSFARSTANGRDSRAASIGFPVPAC